jgi:uncharacterized protein YrrD
MEDLGQPSSYLSLQGGATVYSCDGEQVGSVEHVLSDPGLDIFDGLVLDTSVLPGGHRFVDADQVEEVFERGVLLKLDRKAAEALPEPAKNPESMEVGSDEVSETEGRYQLERKLRRAWDLLSGKEPK